MSDDKLNQVVGVSEPIAPRTSEEIRTEMLAMLIASKARGLRPLLDVATRDALDYSATQLSCKRMRFFGNVEADERFRARLQRAMCTRRGAPPTRDDLRDIFELACDRKLVGFLSDDWDGDEDKEWAAENTARGRRGWPFIRRIGEGFVGWNDVVFDTIIDCRGQGAKGLSQLGVRMADGCEVVVWRDDGWTACIDLSDEAAPSTAKELADESGFGRLRFFGKTESAESQRRRSIRIQNRSVAASALPSTHDLLDILDLAEYAKYVAVVVDDESDAARVSYAVHLENRERRARKDRDLPVIIIITTESAPRHGAHFDAIIDVRCATRDEPLALLLRGEVVLWRHGWVAAGKEGAVASKHIYDDMVEIRQSLTTEDMKAWIQSTEKVRDGKRFFIQGAWSPRDDVGELRDLLERYPKTEPTEHERMAAFFATSEHKRHLDETEPDWSQLDRLLPDECAMPSAPVSGTMSESVQYRQVKGVVEVRTAIHLESGTRHGWWRSLDVLAKGPLSSPWHLERYHDAAHAQKLIREAIPGLPRVRRR